MLGSKQLQATFNELDLRLAFTGIAAVGADAACQRTIDWLAKELKGLPHNSGIKDICDALVRRCADVTAPFGSRGILELVLTAAAIRKPFLVATISNVDWRKHPPEAKSHFTCRIRKITKPFYLISGYRDSVPDLQRHRLRALARNAGKTAKDVLGELTAINEIAAKYGRRYVSEACWVTSQTTDGPLLRSSSRNIGQHPGDIPLLLRGFDLAEWVKKNVRAAPNKKISLVQTAGIVCAPRDFTPLPQPTGEPRQFTLSGASATIRLCSTAGRHCASIDAFQLRHVLEARCNKERTVPFARFALSGVSPIGRDFPKPLLPWPQLEVPLMIGDAAVPRGWKYSVGYWIENNAHHIVIPPSSRSIRNLAFLEPEDEIVIVAPSTTMEFVWSESQEPPAATAHARVWWRSRLDGTQVGAERSSA